MKHARAYSVLLGLAVSLIWLAIAQAQSPSPAAKADAASRIARVAAARDALKACFHDQALRLGSSNTESADTIIRASRSRCMDADHELIAAYAGIYAPEPDMTVALRQDRELAENTAIADLLDVRSHRE